MTIFAFCIIEQLTSREKRWNTQAGQWFAREKMMFLPCKKAGFLVILVYTGLKVPKYVLISEISRMDVPNLPYFVAKRAFLGDGSALAM